jgi:hypothetical protein
MAKGKVAAVSIFFTNNTHKVKNRKPTPHPKDKAGTIKQFKKVTGIKKKKAPELLKANMKKAKTTISNDSKNLIDSSSN